MIVIASKEEKELLQRLRKFQTLDKVDALSAEAIDLKKQIADLEIKKGKLEEKHEKEERELRHMIGLEKKRQEFEIQQSKRETVVQVREENLSADKKRFEENLKFNTERFQTMEDYLKDMMSKILERLPNVNLEINKKGR